MAKISAMRLLLAAAALLLVATRPSRSEACFRYHDGDPNKPEHWHNYPLVGVKLVNEGPNSILLLNPSHTIEEYERALKYVLANMREFNGIRQRLYYAGRSPNKDVQTGYIKISSDIGTCGVGAAEADCEEDSNGYCSTGHVFVRKFTGTGCTSLINWGFLQGPGADFNGVMNHELLHALGLAHIEDCFVPPYPQGIMRLVATNFLRHYQRYDREAVRKDYDELGISYVPRNGTGVTKNFDGVNWIAGTTQGTSSRWFAAGTPSRHGIQVTIDWLRGDGTSTARLNHTWNHTYADVWNSSGQTEFDSWNGTAVAAQSDNGGEVRHYYLVDTSFDGNKSICWRKSTDYGATWVVQGCLVHPVTSSPITTDFLDGLTAEYDEFRNVYVILFLKQCVSGGVFCGNRIHGFVQPGPGNTTITNQYLGDFLGHSTFYAPTIACREDASVADRCIIAFASADAIQYIRWVDGGITSTGTWSTTANRTQGGIGLDLRPAVVWDTANNIWHLAIQKDANKIQTFFKTATATTWTLRSTITESNSVSAPAFGHFRVCIFGCAEGVRLYYTRWQE